VDTVYSWSHWIFAFDIASVGVFTWFVPAFSRNLSHRGRRAIALFFFCIAGSYIFSNPMWYPNPNVPLAHVLVDGLLACAGAAIVITYWIHFLRQIMRRARRRSHPDITNTSLH
jgi:hypothetical protein